jgi:trehalose 6-phosphate synthase/phosphatase
VLLVQVQLPILLSRSAAGAWVAAWDEEALLSPKAQIEAMKKGGSGGAGAGAGAGGWLSRVQIKWIGLLPIEVPPEEEEAVRQTLEPMGCIPVFIEHTTLRAFRDGYCKGTLWPVFHNVMDVYGEIPTRWWLKGQQSDRWKAYTDANARFAATVVETWHEDDLVWLHVRL